MHVYKDVYPPVQGGIERAIYHLTALTRDEFEPSVLVAAGDEKRGSVEVIHGDVPVTKVASFGRALSTPLAPGFITALRRSRADLLHFHFPHPTGEVAYLLSGARAPAVVTYHSDVIRQKRALALYQPMMSAFLNRVSLIMPTSERYMETSETLAPYREKCRVVPLGLPLEDYAATPEIDARAARFRERFGEFVFFIGRLRYYKGLRYLLDAAPALPPGLKIVIAGDGNERAALEAQSARLGLGARVIFMGDVGHEDAVALFRAATSFCLPACERSEAYGLCQIEALACGLPIVSTDLPTGVPEINRHGVTGLIVPPKDPIALIEAISRLAADPALRAEMSRAAIERAHAEYTAVKMAQRVKAVYREALARRGTD